MATKTAEMCNMEDRCEDTRHIVTCHLCHNCHLCHLYPFEHICTLSDITCSKGASSGCIANSAASTRASGTSDGQKLRTAKHLTFDVKLTVLWYSSVNIARNRPVVENAQLSPDTNM